MSEIATAQREQTILDLQPLARTIANTYQPPDGYTRDDLAQEAVIGLIKAVDSFDPERGATLQTWASRCIHNALQNCLRDASKTVPTAPLDGCEFRASTTDDTNAVELKITLDVSPISERSREILRLFLDEELSKAEIARRLKISRMHAGRLVKRAISELEAVIADNRT